MVNISVWTEKFLQLASQAFGSRLWFVGLQGSYGRGEATESSDIDIVVILDELNASDVRIYNDLLDYMPNRDLICGFLSGKCELLQWEPSDLFQFYYDTKPILGSLDCLLPLIDDAAVERAIKIGACNIYHGCVHNMLHEKREEALAGLYKAASFVVQAIYFRKTGTYISQQAELLKIADSDEKEIIRTFLALKSGGEIRLQAMSELLLRWAGKLIRDE